MLDAIVARLMAIEIVVLLEVVDIDHDAGQGVRSRHAKFHIMGRGFLVMATVGDTGQAVAIGLAFEDVPEPFQLGMGVHTGA